MKPIHLPHARWARRLRDDQSGLALIEFAYSLPVLMVLSMGGLEIANLATAHMRVSQIAMLVADNASRERTSIDEADINEIFTGAELAGANLKDFKANTRIFLSDLEPNTQTGTKAGQYIRWQRCWGGGTFTSTYGKAGDGTIGLLGTNFGAGSNNIFTLASGTAAPSAGLNIGVAARANGVYFLGFLARFLQQNGEGNILSTPNLLTLDNEEAKIVIGQNVPFVTGQFTNTGSNNGSVNPFQTIERKDVGLTLRVKPQISENGTVKMQIFQEVSSIDTRSSSSSGLITNKRSIESSVLVDDGAIVVLGGLLQDDTSNSQEKVPGLSNVPFFGNLFKSEARSRKKTNLMVFLRPVVVRDGAAAEALSMGRYEQMRLQQQGFQPLPTGPLPVAGSAVLPPVDTSPTVTPIAPAETKPATPPRQP